MSETTAAVARAWEVEIRLNGRSQADILADVAAKKLTVKQAQDELAQGNDTITAYCSADSGWICLRTSKSGQRPNSAHPDALEKYLLAAEPLLAAIKANRDKTSAALARGATRRHS